MKRHFRIGLGLLIVTASLAQAQTVIYVDENADQEPHDGSSWCHAYLELHEVLDAPGSDTVIRVANGTYLPDPNGLADPREATFQLANGVTIEGGYAGCGAADPDERDFTVYETTLSGDIGTQGNNADNSYHVVTGSGTDATAVLDGFTVTHGRANAAYPHNNGGGMYNWMDGSPTVANCVFSGNTATNGGGGMRNSWSSHPTLISCTFIANSAPSGGGVYNHQSSAPTLTNCTFSGNSSTEAGGGLLNDHACSPTLTTCTFVGNSAPQGGGMYNWVDSNPTLTDCTFIGNTATTEGGGMFNGDSSNPTVVSCTFSGNYAEGDGGAVLNNGSAPVVSRCTFTGNAVGDDGGALCNANGSAATILNCAFSNNSSSGSGGALANLSSSPVLANCIFSANTGGTNGGAVFNHSSDPTLINCTIAGNQANVAGGGVYCRIDSSPTLTNCILWGDTPQEIYVESGDATLAYCDVQGGWGGPGNIDADPLFVEPNNGNLHLQASSACIDAGDNCAFLTGALAMGCLGGDFAGNGRFTDAPATPDSGSGLGSVIDMGAYEFQGTPGDLDGDGDVDLDDFMLFQQQFTGPQ